MLESTLTSRIMRAIRTKYQTDVWLMKVHGSAWQVQGVPDVIGVLRGRFFALEVKLPDGKHGLSRMQKVMLMRLQSAGAVTAVVTTVEEALTVLAEQAG